MNDKIPLSGLFPNLPLEDMQYLDQILDSNEIKDALFSMAPLKSPGVECLHAHFFQKHWNIVGTSVCRLMQHVFSGKDLDPLINRTVLALIPKIPCPSSFKDFRPISLCKVLYKLIAKILVHRLKHIMPRLIAPTQAGLVYGRNITENIIINHEAFDRLIWDFIEDNLHEAGSLLFSTAFLPPLCKFNLMEALVIRSNRGVAFDKAIPSHLTYSSLLWNDSVNVLIVLLKKDYGNLSNLCVEVCRIPSRISNDIEKLIRQFICGSSTQSHGISFVRWDILTQPRANGGLGVRVEINDDFLVRDATLSSGSWNWNLLRHILNPASLPHILIFNLPKLMLDTWDIKAKKWSDLWKLPLSERSKYFLWLSYKDRLLTNLSRFKRNLTDDALCPICGSADESTLHALRDCTATATPIASLLELIYLGMLFLLHIFGRPELIQWKPAPVDWCTLNSDGLNLAWTYGIERLQCQTDCAEAFNLISSPLAPSSFIGLARSIARLMTKPWLLNFVLIRHEANVSHLALQPTGR
ncbi:hypothetical protein F3Y22_tig00111366pilonHSYRG00173 [Hibiscus syriacus]|uniref:Reverse transcriptase zinc-binding domain-containing protein n=1 Tax=Hibiscus syriacus TaxID=106335 RepID=A0A6A2YND1_HIBSY|nr:hypothetical protein F3Y22_tig00111366pilonHSYRG00173 [Hibiscus syriacus]